jgi:hypothetical protein
MIKIELIKSQETNTYYFTINPNLIKYNPNSMYRILTIHAVLKNAIDLSFIISTIKSQIFVMRSFFDCKIVLYHLNLSLYEKSFEFILSTKFPQAKIDLIKEFNLITNDDNFFSKNPNLEEDKIYFEIFSAEMIDTNINTNINSKSNIFKDANETNNGIIIKDYQLILNLNPLNDKFAYRIYLTIKINSGDDNFSHLFCSREKKFLITIYPEKVFSFTNKIKEVQKIDLKYFEYNRLGKTFEFSEDNGIILNDSLIYMQNLVKDYSFSETETKRNLIIFSKSTNLKFELNFENGLLHQNEYSSIKINVKLINGYDPNKNGMFLWNNQMIENDNYFTELFKVKIHERNFPRYYEFYIRGIFRPKPKIKILGPSVEKSAFIRTVGFFYDLESKII